ncbi:DUF3560 domain-containing protein [Agromyces sp. GXS1127]|uniref:DUF3560 domain-containing protein n=1 Tax=Agromyces sp. GXS1127 TaxID=3424181 RepID=UPI003D315D32
MLTITHTHEAGTIIDGTSKGDGSAEVLKANRWRWGRSIAAWYVPNSRDHGPNRHRIEATAAALREAGFEVETVIDDTTRTTAEVEAGKIARQVDRVDALEAKAERKSAAADAAWEAAKRDLARLPEGGEPIKIGHHSEGRHRAAIARADRSMGRSVAAQAEADRAAERAETATHTTGARYNPVTVANRIEKIGADIRRVDRQIEADRYDPETGYQPASDELKAARAKRAAPRLAELRDQLAYWEGVRAQQIADGTATGYTRQQIQKGDLVKIRGNWREVVRANVKTVSLTTGYSWTDTAPYAEIQEHKRP